MKRIMFVLLVLLVIASAAFATATQEKAAEPAEQVRAALITNPKGTSAYINEGIAGFEEACARWNIKGTVVECKGSAEYEENARAAANEGYDLILAGSWEAGSIISELAEIYDDIAFGIIDTLTDSDKVKCIQYFEGEGAYLIGVLAALVVDGESHNYGCINVSQNEKLSEVALWLCTGCSLCRSRGKVHLQLCLWLLRSQPCLRACASAV